MPYVIRDADGRIKAIYNSPRPDAEEVLPADDQEILAFLGHDKRSGDKAAPLLKSDADMARVTEDLVELLIEKKTIRITDFPRGAQEKLLKRKRLRNRLGDTVALVEEEEII